MVRVPKYVRTILTAMNQKDINRTKLAVRMGRPFKTVSRILHCKTTITAETALQLQVVLGVSAHQLLRDQSDYQLDLLRAEKKAANKKIPKKI